MATSLTLENDSSLAQGYLKVNGSTAATLTTSGITGNLTGNVTGSLTAGGSLTLATAQSATGTAVDFTGIPSWAKRITVMFNGVSTDGTSHPLFQIGAGSIISSGYTSTSAYIAGASVNVNFYTTGFGIFSAGASNLLTGHLVLTNLSGNNWVCSAVFGTSAIWFSSGSIALSGSLDRLRVTTVNGTDAFDAGTINISFEG